MTVPWARFPCILCSVWRETFVRTARAENDMYAQRHSIPIYTAAASDRALVRHRISQKAHFAQSKLTAGIFVPVPLETILDSRVSTCQTLKKKVIF